jgi:hypothetical protein
MPLDTSIALGVRPPQFDSPINQMAKLYEMRQAQQANELNQLKLQETQRGMSENEAIRNYFASQDPSSPEFARGLYSISPTQGAAFEKSRAELGKEQAQTGKITAETEATKFETIRKKLDFAGQAYGYVRNNPTLEAVELTLKYLVSNNVFDQAQADQQFELAAQNPTPENIKALADQGFTAVLSAKEQLPTFQMQSTGGATRVLGINPVTGEAEVAPGSEAQMTPLPPDVEAQKTRISRAGATNVNVSTERAYGGEIAKIAAQEDIALASNASSMARQAAKIDEALNLLYKADINTGLGAEMFNVIDKARGKFAGDKKAGKRVESTEYLDSLLGSDVFPQISALGIGARGIDTPAEREFLRNVITGTIKLDRSTLIRMAEFRRKALADAAKVYNEKVESGSLDKYFDYTGRPKVKVELPDSPSANEPMYAVNPKTKERIMSTDGGVSWAPVNE